MVNTVIKILDFLLLNMNLTPLYLENDVDDKTDSIDDDRIDNVVEDTDEESINELIINA
jgi:hypothetical protein